MDIGRDVDREMVEYVIEMVHPDYIQVDCKGHPGLSSYPTEVGHRAPGFVQDPLRIWREVTAEHGIALYVHYSGVWDAEAVNRHPEWARINEQGRPDNRLTSVYGPYVDSLLIPQVKELIDQYQIDGAWVDGECWAIERDYRFANFLTMHKQFGLERLPRSPDDPYWYEFSRYSREGFRDYLKYYVTTLHDYAPDFQIASNWAYSSMMPEPVTIDVDFISGDYSAMNSINSARLEGRSMVHQGKPWDLMAWSFTWTDRHFSTKSIPQLQQEAAMVLSLGGGFQAYFPQRRDGSIRRWQMKLMKEAAEFCRAREALCHNAEPIPQIGLIYSGEAFYRNNQKLFAAWHGELVPLRGNLQALLESQNVVDVVMEHHLRDRMREYPLLIYPEWEYIDPEFKQELLEYVNAGGNLLMIGPRAAALFEEELGVTLVGEPEERLNGLEYGGWLGGVRSLFQRVRLGESARPFGKIYNSDPNNVNDMKGPAETAASIRRYGEGRIAATYLNLGERYYNAATSVSRDFLDTLVRELFPEPLVTVEGSHHVDVTANRKNGRVLINLVNTAGPHANENIYVYDDIPSVGPLQVTIRSEEEPEILRLEPLGRELEYTFREGTLTTTVKSLDLHQILVLE